MAKLIRSIGILFSWFIAFAIFYLCFFVAAPAVCSNITGEFKGFLDFIVYVAIAWLGGVAFPITVGIFGTIFFVYITRN
jgi:hypothetical protein